MLDRRAFDWIASHNLAKAHRVLDGGGFDGGAAIAGGVVPGFDILSAQNGELRARGRVPVLNTGVLFVWEYNADLVRVHPIA